MHLAVKLLIRPVLRAGPAPGNTNGQVTNRTLRRGQSKGESRSHHPAPQPSTSSAGPLTEYSQSKVGDRIAALDPVYQAVIDRYGRLDADIARGIELRHDWGPHYRSHHFGGTVRWLGMTDSPAYIGEPETNGCAERFIRTLKEQCLWVQLCNTIDDLRVAVADWTYTYNNEWLIQRHDRHTPREAFHRAATPVAA